MFILGIWKVVKEGTVSIALGFFSKFYSSATGHSCGFEDFVGVKLKDCEPWTDHIALHALS